MLCVDAVETDWGGVVSMAGPRTASRQRGVVRWGKEGEVHERSWSNRKVGDD